MLGLEFISKAVNKQSVNEIRMQVGRYQKLSGLGSLHEAACLPSQKNTKSWPGCLMHPTKLVPRNSLHYHVISNLCRDSAPHL